MTATPDIIPPAKNDPSDTAEEREAHDDFMAELRAEAAQGDKRREAEDRQNQAEELAALKADLPALYFAGTMTKRADLLIGLLTNLATESILLANGTCPELTEQGYGERKDRAERWSQTNMPEPPKFTGSVTPYLAARSANLRDAVRVSEAVARLMTVHTRTRQAHAAQTVATIDEWQDGDTRRRRVRTTTRFGLEPEGAVIDATPAPDSETASA
jgi:hypothetical protein